MRILLAEDEKLLGESIRTGLIDEQFAVDLVDNGKKALDAAYQDDYDVIILDVMMPLMDGFQVCRTLREQSNFTPIIFLTAKDLIEDKVTGLDAGADDYLIKPFSFDELLARIRSLLRRNTVKSPLLKLDSLELNPATHIVRRNGKEIKLTGKEYALLEYMMRHPNQILTKDQILTHVWDYSYDAVSNIIEVLIKRLRSKIDKEFPMEKDLFQTIRGLGYKLTDSA